MFLIDTEINYYKILLFYLKFRHLEPAALGTNNKCVILEFILYNLAF